jgi:SAM-dependent methyltransferase
MAASPTYDVIGHTYAQRRRADPRIAELIHSALGDSRSVVNVGAGSGSYEPRDRTVVAVEPSEVMLRQRAVDAGAAVRSSAESLPFGDATFDASLAILTVHHWSDRRAGLAEMKRVARQRVVVLTWDPAHEGFWLVRDYFPEIIALDRRIFPALADFEDVLGPVDVQVVPVPYDCVDGFLGAYWRRPAEYLDAGVRSAISSFARIGDAAPGLARLREDIHSGVWARRNADVAGIQELDIGYRLIVASRLEPCE